MMQPAQNRKAKNVSDGLNGTRTGASLFRGQMRSYLVVVFHVRQQCVPKMSFTQNDDMIDAFPTDRADQPFSISVLPWGARRRWSITNAH
jgi:hypothetical protein